jgi:glutathione-independent formaldehyde dehydrogenase
MKAIVYDNTRRVAVQQVPDAVIEEPGDVVIRVTSSAICGTDLHMYDGRTGAEHGLVLGHEAVGTVEEVGPTVTLLEPGERVAVPTHLFCGLCFNCVRGYSAACLRVRPGGFGAAYGYAGMGPYRGAQAELLRIPYADANCVSLPGEPGDDREDDFVLLADAFVTGWHATELAEVTPATSPRRTRSNRSASYATPGSRTARHGVRGSWPGGWARSTRSASRRGTAPTRPGSGRPR